MEEGKECLTMKIEDPDFECNITAVVGFVSPENQPNNFLMQHNAKKNGWDIPGGHCDEGESPKEAFIREAFEETNAIIIPEACHEIARLDFENGTGIAVFDAQCQDGNFSPINQVESDGGIDEVLTFSMHEAVELYFGNKELFGSLIKIVIDSHQMRKGSTTTA